MVLKAGKGGKRITWEGNEMEKFHFLAVAAPGFAVSGSQVKVLASPTQFHETVCSRVAAAQRRVCLAALYLGTGHQEQALVDSLGKFLDGSEKGSNGTDNIDDDDVRPTKRRAQILLDYCRGNRPEGRGEGPTTSAQMLLPLVDKHQVLRLTASGTLTIRKLVFIHGSVQFL